MLPTWPSNINRRGKYKMPDESIQRYTITDEIIHQSTQPPTDMLFYWQRLEYDTGEVELRLGYYIICKKPNSKNLGKWVWGQYCPSMSPQDLHALVEKAKAKNWILS